MSTQPIKRLCVIGVGLIGGSLARALRAAQAVEEIVGCGRDEAHLQRAQALGVIDRYVMDPAQAVGDADVVVVAVPVGACEGIFRAIAPGLAADTVVTDVGSTKGSVVDAAQRAFGRLPACFVPGHPIAGNERSGVEASLVDLFVDRTVILTPHADTKPACLAKVRAMWEACGARVVAMPAQHHDEVLAATSHLPHMLAYLLVDTLARMHDKTEIFAYAAGGFRDFTRIASSDPEMWHDICFANREALLDVLERYRGQLDELIQAVRAGNSDYIREVFVRAKQARDNFTADKKS
ncbi:MAG: prephenate dehydrogenase [Gammaproteobacteria bacterium SG8_47]|nr:MAG: prephenate dehydrogenase [Gammaproteobacteria bacterium SG8_47]